MLRKMLLSAGVVAAGLVAVPAQPAVGDPVCGRASVTQPIMTRDTGYLCTPDVLVTTTHEYFCVGQAVASGVAVRVCVDLIIPT